MSVVTLKSCVKQYSDSIGGAMPPRDSRLSMEQQYEARMRWFLKIAKEKQIRRRRSISRGRSDTYTRNIPKFPHPSSSTFYNRQMEWQKRKDWNAEIERVQKIKEKEIKESQEIVQFRPKIRSHRNSTQQADVSNILQSLNRVKQILEMH